MQTLEIKTIEITDSMTGDVIQTVMECEWEGKIISIPKSLSNRFYADIMKKVDNGELTLVEQE
jgi:hypothetical protein